jgi:hypothetical protein
MDASEKAYPTVGLATGYNKLRLGDLDINLFQEP